MKKIEATIRSSKFDDVKEALHRIDIDYFTFFEVKGVGKEKTPEGFYRGAYYDLGSIPRIMLELVVPDDLVDKAVESILSSAKTGDIGDGKVFIYDVLSAIRIRTGEVGEAAL
ncbi:nitrogen regulatory protein P-II 1 [Catalinimonas alkaloidigena]|uniref:Nitrogen regulatory protein P-II 1 n=1 Tax=Catalinimonas alkaloidigena TaxID=1075417 RepID=A0A1G9K6J2_9BACT|nr:P-II family nitrogen regulator [Catalinimonas alkaloidigena]SDL45510.1 nitrogen regulatory protein P-II 1 [Catalinimonas alkaloidigena]